MVPKPLNYEIYPSVFPADTETEVIIAPTERAFLFFDDKEYSLNIIPVNTDETSYYSPTLHDKFTVKAKDGKVSFRGFRGRYHLNWKNADGTAGYKSIDVE